jgi:hypothetical protein
MFANPKSTDCNISSYLTKLSWFVVDAREGLFACLLRFFPQSSPSIIYNSQVNYTHCWTVLLLPLCVFATGCASVPNQFLNTKEVAVSSTGLSRLLTPVRHGYILMVFIPQWRFKEPVTVAARSDMQYLRSLGRWDRGFESHSRHDWLVCVCVYSVFVLSCV